ncbi:histidine kinase [Nocardioides sp. C4-1]|uniref:sensor histidine kinase n=1 Tax=Nocardioides sp. C4-1 TaxID=3151851 RepID=UPI003265D9AE
MPPDPRWRELAVPHRAIGSDRPVRARRLLVRITALSVLVLVAVVVVGGWAARREAEDESVTAAADRTEILADAVVQPALQDGVLDGDPAALVALDDVVRQHVLGDDVARVKVWSRDGRIVYSDEQRLVGQQFALDDEELEAFDEHFTGAEVTDLDEPENVYERDQGKLLEVYHPVVTPDGTELLFETYGPYDRVTERRSEIWRGFSAITLGSLVVLLLVLLPVVWQLLRRLERHQEHRERLLQQALSASDTERRRIAGSLHDGPVQELAGVSFVVSGAAQRARDDGDTAMGDQLDEVASAVRAGMGGLRSLLVEVYPASLSATGLDAALHDLATGLDGRDVVVELDLDADVVRRLSDDDAQLVFQVVRECLRNVAKHAAARRVRVSVATARRPGTGAVTRVEVADDGTGFDVDAVLADPAPGHLGVLLLRDVARRHGAGLAVRSEAGAGTTWRLDVVA